MSAVYSVSLDLLYSDANSVIASTRDFVSDYGPRASFSDVDYSSILSAVQIILPARGMGGVAESDNKFSCYCDFNASYGWESVMTDWFNYLVQSGCLFNGSTLRIEPDDGWIQGVSSGTSVTWSTDDGNEWVRSETGISVSPIPAGPDVIAYKSNDADLQMALDAINEYLIDEFGEDHIVTEDDNLSDIGLLYSTAGDDNEYEVEAMVNLIDPSILYFVNGDLVDKEEYFDLVELADALKYISFDGLYNACVQNINFGDSED